MERMNEYIKDRTEAFDDLFPSKKFSFKTVKNWIASFKFFYNFVFTNEDLGRAPLSDDLLPEWLRVISLIIGLR
ncbi:MAG: hypothetical protein ACP5LF_06680, partial [Nitrososphaeria archaeon]